MKLEPIEEQLQISITDIEQFNFLTFQSSLPFFARHMFANHRVGGLSPQTNKRATILIQ